MGLRALVGFSVTLVACGGAPPRDTLVLAQDSAEVTAAMTSPRPVDGAGAATNQPQAPAQPQTPPAPPTPPAADPATIAAPPDVAAPPAAAQRTPSGLATLVLRPGTGAAHPAPTSTVVAHYTGWTTDGRMFDSSRTRGTPFTAPVGGVIPGFAEGLQLMVVGEQRRLWIPQDLAYRGLPGRPAGMLVFDVELLSIQP